MSQAPVRPFYRHLGLEVLEAQDGRALVRLPASEVLLNGRGEVHGGAIAALMDAALSNAARVALPPGSSVATVQFTAHYLVPGHGVLVSEGRAVRAGRAIVTAEVHVRDEAGTLVAQGLGTLRVLRR